MAETDAQEVPDEHEEELLYCAADRALEQIVQGGCGVSLTGDTQEPSGHNPVPRALGRPCLSREVGPDDPLRSFPTCPALRFRAEPRTAGPSRGVPRLRGRRTTAEALQARPPPSPPPSLPPPRLPAAALAAPRLCPRRWGMFIVAGSRPNTRNAAGRPAPTDRHRAAPCPAPPRPPPARM
ncbi:TATA box-binding protein-like 1 isoform X2 [Anomalospiza imberbis]|uniref:TATA box-binding protein-like 1 isoform X2 n=1 Tax=Anomalospiza imberbis TaxID=187417 RepID=UPI00358F1788